MPYIWVLWCSKCGETFAPQEDDWDGDITCPHCGNVDLVDHDNYGGPENVIEVELEDPWPLCLTDEELDKAYRSSDLFPQVLEQIIQEYARRGRVPPDGDVV